MKRNEKGGACGTQDSEVFVEALRKNRLEGLGTEGRVILKIILKK
jgi:hypothetical protein